MNITRFVGDVQSTLREGVATTGARPAMVKFIFTGANQSILAMSWREARSRARANEFAVVVFSEDASEWLFLPNPLDFPGLAYKTVLLVSAASGGMVGLDGAFAGDVIHYPSMSAETASVMSVVVFPLRKRNVKVDFAIRFSGVG